MKRWRRRLVAVVVTWSCYVPAVRAQDKDKNGKDTASGETLIQRGDPSGSRVNAGASPGSLWGGSLATVELATDLRARNVGDLVTIRIVESVRAQQVAATDSSRDANISGGIDFLFGLQNQVPSSLELDQLVGANSSNDFQGGGSNSRTNALTTTVTARVIEVLPNGYLRVEASRLIQVNEEKERLSLTGIVRPYDIGPRNDVLSTQIADVEIRYGGKGVIGSNLKPGLLMRLLRFLF